MLYKHFWMLIQVTFPSSNDAPCSNLACNVKILMSGSTDKIIQRAFLPRKHGYSMNCIFTSFSEQEW